MSSWDAKDTLALSQINQNGNTFQTVAHPSKCVVCAPSIENRSRAVAAGGIPTFLIWVLSPSRMILELGCKEPNARVKQT